LFARKLDERSTVELENLRSVASVSIRTSAFGNKGSNLNTSLRRIAELRVQSIKQTLDIRCLNLCAVEPLSGHLDKGSPAVARLGTDFRQTLDYLRLALDARVRCGRSSTLLFLRPNPTRRAAQPRRRLRERCGPAGLTRPKP